MCSLGLILSTNIGYDTPTNKIGGVIMPKMSEEWYQSKSGNWYSKIHQDGRLAHIRVICFECGEEFFERKFKSTLKGGKGRHFCSHSCTSKFTVREQDISHLKQYEFKKGQVPHNYKGGSFRKDGRRVVIENGKKHLEYRNIVEQFLGRKLKPSEVIHHENGNVTDNRLENLRLMTQSEHAKIHWERGDHDNRSN